MRRQVALALMMFMAQTVSALSLEELEAARQAAEARARAAAGVDLSTGSDGGRPIPGEMGSRPPDYGGCIGSAPGGRMSLLGVQSDMGPSTQGITPAAKLGPDHPARKALSELGTRMGLYADREGASEEEKTRNAAARKLRAQYEFYEEILGLLNWGSGETGRITEAAGFEQYAQAHREYQALARQYAALFQVAEETGRACP